MIVMKRLSIVGLCLAAAMIVSALAVSSAFAVQPKFEATKFPVSFTSESLLPLEPELFSNVAGVTVLCQMSSATGEMATATTIAKIVVLYTGCKLQGSSTACTTAGQAAGMISTKEINGTTGEIGGGSTAGILLKPTTGAIFAEFNCGALVGKVTVGNAVIGEGRPFKLGSRSNVGELVFEPNATNTGQKWANFVGGPICELSVDTSFKGWIMDRQLQTFGEPVELK